MIRDDYGAANNPYRFERDEGSGSREKTEALVEAEAVDADRTWETRRRADACD
jgi:hypothetical protein